MVDEPSKPSNYVLESHGVEVSVWPELESKTSNFSGTVFNYVYTIKVKNFSGDSVQLRRRHWEITNAFGETQVVDGEGVVGEQPLLRHGESFLYSSFCPLGTPTGSMKGHFEFDTSSGTVRVKVPEFKLQSKSDTN